MKLLVYACAVAWTWWLGWVALGHQLPSILLRTSITKTWFGGFLEALRWMWSQSISLRMSSNNSYCWYNLIVPVSLISCNSVADVLRNTMFLIYQAHSGKHHNSIFRCGRPSKKQSVSKRFYLRTCSFLALPSGGLNFLTWHALQRRVIFLTLLFMKLPISSFGAPGVRFLQLATLEPIILDDLLGWKILISYCFLQWLLAIHCVPHTGPKSNLHCNFQHLHWSSTSISGPNNLVPKTVFCC